MSKSLEARVIVNECLLQGVIWSQPLNKPVASVFIDQIRAVNESLKKAEPVDTQLMQEIDRLMKLALAKLPKM